jgi:hypothetical protein
VADPLAEDEATLGAAAAFQIANIYITVRIELGLHPVLAALAVGPYNGFFALTLPVEANLPLADGHLLAGREIARHQISVTVPAAL